MFLMTRQNRLDLLRGLCLSRIIFNGGNAEEAAEEGRKNIFFCELCGLCSAASALKILL